MERERKAYLVYVDLDPVPGLMHSQESAQNVIRNVLNQSIGHYNPTVSLAPSELQTDESKLYQAEADFIRTTTFSLNDEDDARAVIDFMTGQIKRSGWVSVAMFYNAINLTERLPALYASHYKWGWTSPEGFSYRSLDGGGAYILDIPPTKLLNNDKI